MNGTHRDKNTRLICMIYVNLWENNNKTKREVNHKCTTVPFFIIKLHLFSRIMSIWCWIKYVKLKIFLFQCIAAATSVAAVDNVWCHNRPFPISINHFVTNNITHPKRQEGSKQQQQQQKEKNVIAKHSEIN